MATAAFLAVCISAASAAPTFETHVLDSYNFTASASASDFVGLFPGDFDGDGDTDLSLSGFFRDSSGGFTGVTGVEIHENIDGAATDLQVHQFPVTEWHGHVADVDGDGSDDMLNVQGNVRWVEYTGGSEPEVIVHVLESVLGNEVIPVDWEGDGDQDLVVFSGPGTFSVWLSDGAEEPSFTQAGGFLNAARDFAAGDLDGDGLMDVVTLTDVNVNWFRQTQADPLDFAGEQVQPLAGELLELADADGDGDLDLFIANEASLLMIENQAGDASAWKTWPVDPAATSPITDLIATDVNRDGISDLVTRRLDGKVHTHVMGAGDPSDWQREEIGTLISEEGSFGTPPLVRLWVDDIDGDGFFDFGGVTFEAFFSVPITSWVSSGEALWFENETPGLVVAEASLVRDGAGEVHVPGEEGVFAVTVMAEAGPFTDVIVMPESLDPSLQITGGPTTIPSLGVGESQTVTFDYTLAMDAPCPGTVAATARAAVGDLQAEGSDAFSLGTHFVQALARAEAPGVTIPDSDPAGLVRTLSVVAAGEVLTADFGVSVDISHPFRGDLIVDLSHPDGTTVRLFANPGDTGDDVVLSRAVPEFVGKPPAGDYTLRVEDTGIEDIGTLNSWAIDLQVEGVTCTVASGASLVEMLLGQPVPAGSYDLNGDGRVDVADLVTSIERGL